MEKISDLLHRLCPEGVSRKVIKDVFTRLKGTPITAGQMKEIEDPDGDVVIFAGGKTIITAFEKDIPNANIISCPSVIVQSRGIIDVQYCVSPFTFKNEMWAYTNENVVCVKYLYYFLKQNIEILRKKGSEHGSMPQISLGTTEDLEIPFPPLSIQQEIVRILDSFTSMITNLETELASRQKQYEHYRNKLLTFDENDDSVEWKTFGSLASSYSGLSGKSKVDFVDGNAKFIPYMNIFANPATSLAITEKVKVLESEKQNQIKYGDMFFTTSSETPDECGMSSVLCAEIDEPIYLNSFCFGMRFHDLSNKEPRYFKHLLRCTHIRKEISKAANGVTRFNISKKVFEKILIPIPTLQRQQEIVSTLDTFESLITNIKQELEARKKQYEYYREQLLTFRPSPTLP